MSTSTEIPSSPNPQSKELLTTAVKEVISTLVGAIEEENLVVDEVADDVSYPDEMMEKIAVMSSVDDQDVTENQPSSGNTPSSPRSKEKHDIVTCTPSTEDTLAALVNEAEVAAMENIQDEAYWEDLMERIRLMRIKNMKTPPKTTFIEPENEQSEPQVVTHDEVSCVCDDDSVSSASTTPSHYISRQQPKAPSPLPLTLHQAVQKNLRGDVLRILETHPDVNECNVNGSTALHFACVNGDLELVQLLHQHKATLDIANNLGITPMHCACEAGALPIVKFLQLHGVPLDPVSIKGKTPLHCACLHGSVDIVNFLLECKANLTATCEDGSQALHFACHSGNLELVQLLVNRGCSPHYSNHRGETPFIWACERGHIDVMQYLQTQHVNVFCRCKFGHTALHYAAMFGHLHAVEYLISKIGLQVDATDNEMGTALHCACQKGHYAVAKYFVNTPCLHINTSTRITPLHSACDGGNLEIVKLLLEHGANMYATDVDGRTPLHYACYRGHINIAEYFVVNFDDGFAMFMACNKRGSNCLHLAAQMGHQELVEYIIFCGVNINCQNNSGNTPLHMASENGHVELAKWLAENGAKLWI